MYSIRDILIFSLLLSPLQVTASSASEQKWYAWIFAYTKRLQIQPKDIYFLTSSGGFHGYGNHAKAVITTQDRHHIYLKFPIGPAPHSTAQPLEVEKHPFSSAQMSTFKTAITQLPQAPYNRPGVFDNFRYTFAHLQVPTTPDTKHPYQVQQRIEFDHPAEVRHPKKEDLKVGTDVQKYHNILNALNIKKE
ncbi:MAG: hypothetical protein OXT67_13775 [Zetaproteobacteria bacterium]|nr:hypothetical protein [Zetaproteobacteria bacterium]